MSNRVEDEAKLIHVGATLQQLAQMFGMSHKTVQARVVGRVSPARVKGQSERDSLRYHVRDVAPLLCEPKVDLEEVLKSLSPEKIPPKLQDAFWKAQKTRLEVEESLGQLWNTERVVTVLGDAYKPMRMTILMFQELVEQQVELTPRQREIITQLSDGLLNELNHALIEAFKDYRPAENEHGTPISSVSTVVVSPDFIKEDAFDDGFGDE